MDPIYKTPWGKHIDLAKIAAVSDASVRLSSGQVIGAHFHIDVQLRDSPIEYYRGTRREDEFGPEFKWIEDDTNHRLSYHALAVKNPDGTIRYLDRKQSTYFSADALAGGQLLCVANLQAQVDEIIAAWKAYRAWENEQKFAK